MSLYAEYLKERTEDHIRECATGFVTYRYLPDEKTVYIVDLYVIPAERKKGVASWLADCVMAEAKDHGRTFLLGSIKPSAKGSTASMEVLLAYGMELDSAGPDAIFFRKAI